jgi:hypothetical protein
MGYSAKLVHLEAVSCVKRCGISFNFMLGHAKNQNAMFHAAGLCINLILKSLTSLG